MSFSAFFNVVETLTFCMVLLSCDVICKAIELHHQDNESHHRERRAVCSPGWTDVSGVCAQNVDDAPRSWWEAHLDCTQRGGYLSTKDNMATPLNAIGCPAGSYPNENQTYCYELTDTPGTLQEARDYCQTKGGDVPDVWSSEEIQTILGEVSSQGIAFKGGSEWRNGFWIGQHTADGGGAWVYLSDNGETVYLEWAPNQPSGLSSETCAVLIYDDVNPPSGHAGKMLSTGCEDAGNKIMCKYKAGAWVGAAWATSDVRFVDNTIVAAMWFDGVPPNDKCALERGDGTWDADDCASLHPYVCREGTLSSISSNLVGSVVTRVAEADIACPNSAAPAQAFFNDATSKCYWLTATEGLAWQTAEDDCNLTENSTLVMIATTAEADFVYTKAIEKDQGLLCTWIGLRHDGAAWVDVNGDSVTYTNWVGGVVPLATSCGAISFPESGQWDSKDCILPIYPGICELKIEFPTTTSHESTIATDNPTLAENSNITEASRLEAELGNIRHAVVTGNQPEDHASVAAILEEVTSLLLSSSSDLTPKSIDSLMDITTAVSRVSAQYQDTVEDVLDITDIILTDDNKRSLVAESSEDTFAHFLQTMDAFTFQIASGNSVIDDFLAMDNLDLHSQYGVKPDKDDYYLEVKGDGYSSGVLVPHDIFHERLGNMAVLVYKTLHQVAPDQTASHPPGDLTFNSHIYAVSFVLEDGKQANFTDELVSFYFQRLEGSTGGQQCSFWRHELRAWSTEGCFMDHGAGNATHTVCRCNHLTNFAILMQYTEVANLGIHEDILQYMTYIGVSLSILCLIVTLLIYLIGKLLKSQRIIIHANLAMSLLAGQVIFIGGIDATHNSTICTTIAFMLHYFFLAAFSWMLIEGIHLYMKSTMIFGKEIKTWVFFLLGWGLPIVIVGITFAIRHDGYGREGSGSCWLSTDNGLSWAFIGPILAIVLINTIILIMVIRVFMTLKANADKTEVQRVKTGIRAILMLQPLLGLSWLFGVFGMDANTVIFQYLFVICNSLQGVFIFICHCVTNEEVRCIFLKRYKKMASAVNTTSSGTSSSAMTETTQATTKGQAQALQGSTSSKKAWI